MKRTLTFLGTGTSTGVPYIGCDCKVCRSHDPRDNRLRSSAIIKIGDTHLLIDCGPDFRQQILRNDIKQIDGCLITHSHYDHVGGIDDLRPFCTPEGFPLYCKADVAATLRDHIPYAFADTAHHYPGAPILSCNIIEPLKPFKIKDIDILPLPVNHYLMDIVGFRINSLAYITDAKIIPAATMESLRGVDTLIINALRIEPHISHMNLSDALNVINTVKPRKAYLTHISHQMGLQVQVNQTLPPGVELAYDGLTIEF